MQMMWYYKADADELTQANTSQLERNARNRSVVSVPVLARRSRIRHWNDGSNMFTL